MFLPPTQITAAFVSSPIFACASPSPSTSAASPSTDAKPTVFVAGATGNVGIRVVRLLTEQGCKVRAMVRDPSKLEAELEYTDTLPPPSTEPSEEEESEPQQKQQQLVETVKLDVKKSSVSDFETAIGSSTNIVVSALGSPFSFGRVDGKGVADLMTAASKCSSVDTMIVVSSIGVGRPWALPAGLLNLFGGVLFFKDFSENVTRSVAKKTGKKFLIVRPGGMESPTDDFGLTHNMKIEPRNTLSGGLVSNLQIAQLIVEACVQHGNDTLFGKTGGKTVEVVAETDAPKVPLIDLLKNAADDW